MHRCSDINCIAEAIGVCLAAEHFRVHAFDDAGRMVLYHVCVLSDHRRGFVTHQMHKFWQCCLARQTVGGEAVPRVVKVKIFDFRLRDGLVKI